MISLGLGGIEKGLLSSLSASKYCLTSVAYELCTFLVTEPEKKDSALASCSPKAPVGRILAERAKKGWGCVENLGDAVGLGTVLELFLLSKSKMKPFLLPPLILMKFPEKNTMYTLE